MVFRRLLKFIASDSDTQPRTQLNYSESQLANLVNEANTALKEHIFKAGFEAINFKLNFGNEFPVAGLNISQKDQSKLLLELVDNRKTMSPVLLDRVQVLVLSEADKVIKKVKLANPKSEGSQVPQREVEFEIEAGQNYKLGLEILPKEEVQSNHDSEESRKAGESISKLS